MISKEFPLAYINHFIGECHQYLQQRCLTYSQQQISIQVAGVALRCQKSCSWANSRNKKHGKVAANRQTPFQIHAAPPNVGSLFFCLRTLAAMKGAGSRWRCPRNPNGWSGQSGLCWWVSPSTPSAVLGMHCRRSNQLPLLGEWRQHGDPPPMPPPPEPRHAETDQKVALASCHEVASLVPCCFRSSGVGTSWHHCWLTFYLCLASRTTMRDFPENFASFRPRFPWCVQKSWISLIIMEPVPPGFQPLGRAPASVFTRAWPAWLRPLSQCHQLFWGFGGPKILDQRFQAGFSHPWSFSLVFVHQIHQPKITLKRWRSEANFRY